MNLFKKSAQDRAFNELLFEHRNKAYGAYDLRMEYDRILGRAFLLGVSLFALAAATPMIVQNFSGSSNTPVVADSGPFILKELPPEHVDETPPPAVQPPVKVQENTVKIEIPTPARQPEVETPVVSQQKIKDASIGHENMEGTKPQEIYRPIEKTVPAEPVKPAVEVPDETAHTTVDVEAKFAGGIDRFRTQFSDRFDTGNVEAEGVVQTVVTFIVERDGSISNIKATGSNAAFNQEAERTIRSMKHKWTPAQIKGKSVRSYFKFPVKMQIE